MSKNPQKKISVEPIYRRYINAGRSDISFKYWINGVLNDALIILEKKKKELIK